MGPRQPSADGHFPHTPDGARRSLTIDFDYFDGCYAGDQACLDGRITYDERLANVDAYNWFYDLVHYQSSVTASSRGSHTPPISS